MQSKLLILLIISVFIPSAIAQDDSSATDDEVSSALPVAAQMVEVDADDGLDLIADFYLVDPARPTVILLHEIYTTRESWEPLLLPLLANGYNVLAPDIRGWGETRGAINWFDAVDDVAVWFIWLREVAGVNPEAIHTVGSSMGSSLAIVGCAEDEFCRSAIGISPGWNYYRISLADSITERPVLGIYSERDRFPALGVPQMIETAPDTFVPLTYEGNAHGMDLFADEQETIVVAIIEWLNTH
ncbi:MAG: alpha/beta fold hydrolase [Chloroflexota bacterium]